MTSGRKEHIMNMFALQVKRDERSFESIPCWPDTVSLNGPANVTFTVTVGFRISPWNFWIYGVTVVVEKTLGLTGALPMSPGRCGGGA